MSIHNDMGLWGPTTDLIPGFHSYMAPQPLPRGGDVSDKSINNSAESSHSDKELHAVLQEYRECLADSAAYAWLIEA